MSDAPVGILLAAGQGKRFGANKLLHPLDHGIAMAIACARPLRAALPGVIAVVEDERNEVARLLRREGLQVIANPRAQEGMGTSIACGVAHSATARGWLIAMADMPYVQESSIRAVGAALERGADIAAPIYDGQRGHPVGFSVRHAPALMQLTGDVGARAILAAHRAGLELIEVQDEGVVVDIDVKPESVREPRNR